jgi:hypothetical protein
MMSWSAQQVSTGQSSELGGGWNEGWNVRRRVHTCSNVGSQWLHCAALQHTRLAADAVRGTGSSEPPVSDSPFNRAVS